MITDTTRLTPPRPQDGTLRDLDPYRRAARLRRGGVAIERTAPWAYTVALPDGAAHTRRTFSSAERAAHAFLDGQSAS